MNLAPIFWCCLLLAKSVFALLPWVQFSAGPSKRSQGCDSDGANDCVCLGTENGRTVVHVDGLSHYSRLRKSFVRCHRIIGNLEITHIDLEDMKMAEMERQKELALNGTENGGGGVDEIGRAEKPFQFLEHLEEITGYLLIFNVNLTELALPKLRVIWGEKLHEGNALHIESSPGLRVLNLPSLRTIEEGKLTIRRSPNLCYMNWRKGSSSKYVDYSEILSGGTLERRLDLDNFSRKCRSALPCHQTCNGSCFGPKKDQCQTIYRKNCHQFCESMACFVDDKGTGRCCDDACAGGCFGEGRDMCVACKKFEQDGKCVSQCRGTHAYNPNTLEREELAEAERRFAYGRHCVRQCPAGSLVENEHCVSRCSIGHFRDAQTDDGRCVPCPEGRCPRVCQLNEPLDAVNIQRLANCSEIEGNIEILGYAFQEHMPQWAAARAASSGPIPDSSPMVIPALNASQLNVLKSVRIVTGYVALDGSMVPSRAKPKSMEFLENVEVIEGRKLYFEKYALYVIGNVDLKWLGLRSLRRIKHGLVSIRRNMRLCYSYTVPFERALGVRQSLWAENMEPAKCEKQRRKCHTNCDAEMGCWGPGPAQCVQCRNFSRDGECAEHCPKQGYFVPTASSNQCQRCHEQCRFCHGPAATECAECLNFELWIGETDAAVGGGTERPLADHVEGAVRKCVAKCPNGTFEAANQCQPCHPACQNGCTGPSVRVGPGGCNRCQFAVERDDGLICLEGEEPVNGVCAERNDLPAAGYFLSLDPFSSLSKFICRKCRPECSWCSRDGTAGDICKCAFWNMTAWDDSDASECALECGIGSRILDDPRNVSSSGGEIPRCQRCHPLCDPHASCSGNGPQHCDRCANGGMATENGTMCLPSCPPDFPYKDDVGMCQAADPERVRQQKQLAIALCALLALLFVASIIGCLVYRCLIYQKKYIKEVQMHLPEIPPLDPLKITQRPNMRRLNLIQINELDFAPGKSTVLGQGAFGIVYAGKWRPPGVKVNIPVAIKAISQQESQHVNEKEMLKEAGLMHSVQHEHLLPVAGICLGGGPIKIVTLLRPLGSLLRFFEQYRNQLGSKQLMLYCYQISSAMEYLAKKGIVHRDLAARNVLVKNAVHVEVTDFGLATMLQRPGESVVIDGKVAVKWLAPESLRRQVYNELTDVWSFGVTCWEILTLGASAPYKELSLRRERMAKELADELERGHRLPMPENCTYEFQQELIKCWMFNPESRPKFRQIKEHLEQFCRAPHAYIRERHQRMESISSQEQQAMIARLLKDSDFLDPVNVDPAEYMPAARDKRAASSSPDTLTTDCFLLSTNDGGSANNHQCSPPPARRIDQHGSRHGSTGTAASSRYKSEPIGRKWSQPWAMDESTAGGVGRTTTDEENYLVPKRELGRFIDEEDDEDGAEGMEEEEEEYTPVVDGTMAVCGGDGSSEWHTAHLPTYTNQQQQQRRMVEYENGGGIDEGATGLVIASSSPADGEKQGKMAMSYVNVEKAAPAEVQQNETTI